MFWNHREGVQIPVRKEARKSFKFLIIPQQRAEKWVELAIKNVCRTSGNIFNIQLRTWGMGIGAAAAAKSLQSCRTLCNPTDGSPPGSPVPGILQARTLERVAISFSNAWKWKVKVKSQSSPTPSDPMDSSLPGSSVHGFSRQEYWSGVPWTIAIIIIIIIKQVSRIVVL